MRRRGIFPHSIAKSHLIYSDTHVTIRRRPDHVSQNHPALPIHDGAWYNYSGADIRESMFALRIIKTCLPVCFDWVC